MLIDLIKSQFGGNTPVAPDKVAKGFAVLIIDLMEHAPQLALLALAAYADFQMGNLPGMAEVVGKAAPILKDAVDNANVQ